MEKNAHFPLKDILDSCDRIIGNVKDVTIEDFRSDINLQDAVMRRFEIIGEATKRVSVEIRNQFPDIAWKEAAGFRDILIHDYPEIIIDEVFDTAKNHLPAFRDQINRIIEKQG